MTRVEYVSRKCVYFFLKILSLGVMSKWGEGLLTRTWNWHFQDTGSGGTKELEDMVFPRVGCSLEHECDVCMGLSEKVLGKDNIENVGLTILA